MALRDLRDDLRQRLRGIEIERAALQGRIEFLEDTEQHLQASLKYEEMRVRSEEHNMTLPFLGTENEREGSALTMFVRDTLSDGRTWSLDELKGAAERAAISFDGKQPGRVLHFVLLGMSQNGGTEMVSKGMWRLRQNAPETPQERDSQAKGA